MIKARSGAEPVLRSGDVMADLEIDYAALDEIHRVLEKLAAALERSEARRDELESRWGGPEVRRAMRGFVDDWDRHRHKLIASLRDLSDKSAGTAETFRAVEAAQPRPAARLGEDSAAVRHHGGDHRRRGARVDSTSGRAPGEAPHCDRFGPEQRWTRPLPADRTGSRAVARGVVPGRRGLVRRGRVADPALLVTALSCSAGVAPISVGGVLGVRTESAAPADELRGVAVGSRRVDYVLPVPGDPDRWLSVAFSALTADDADPEVTDLLVELFDAIMTTFRWATAGLPQPGRHAESWTQSFP